jgi:hypothetical protein
VLHSSREFYDFPIKQELRADPTQLQFYKEFYKEIGFLQSESITKKVEPQLGYKSPPVQSS